MSSLAIFLAFVASPPTREGWRSVEDSWAYFRQGKALVRLANVWDEPRPALTVDGVHVFRDVNDLSVCGYDGPRRLWSRKLDLGSPCPMVVGTHILALRSGRSIVWGSIKGDETATALEHRWSIRRKAENVEVISARGKRCFSASVYDVGEPRCIVRDRDLWTIKEVSARSVFVGSRRTPHPRYALCLRNATSGGLLRQWRLPRHLGEGWSSAWHPRADASGRVLMMSSQGLLFVYNKGALYLGKSLKPLRELRSRGVTGRSL